MRSYILKVTKSEDDKYAGAKGLGDMTQDTGAARLAGAVEIYDFIGKGLGLGSSFENDLVRNEGLSINDESRPSNDLKTKVTSYAKLYKAEYQALKAGRKKNVHRRAAAAARAQSRRNEPAKNRIMS